MSESEFYKIETLADARKAVDENPDHEYWLGRPEHLKLIREIYDEMGIPTILDLTSELVATCPGSRLIVYKYRRPRIA